MLDILNKHLEDKPSSCVVDTWIKSLKEDEQEAFNFNWVKHSSEKIKQVLKILELDESNLFSCFNRYLETNILTDNWKIQANRLLATPNLK